MSIWNLFRDHHFLIDACEDKVEANFLLIKLSFDFCSTKFDLIQKPNRTGWNGTVYKYQFNFLSEKWVGLNYPQKLHLDDCESSKKWLTTSVQWWSTIAKIKYFFLFKNSEIIWCSCYVAISREKFILKNHNFFFHKLY